MKTTHCKTTTKYGSNKVKKNNGSIELLFTPYAMKQSKLYSKLENIQCSKAPLFLIYFSYNNLSPLYMIEHAFGFSSLNMVVYGSS